MAEGAKGSGTRALKFLLGAVLVLSGGLASVVFWPQLKTIAAGALGPFLILAGLVVIAVTKE